MADALVKLVPGHVIQFDYVNHRGEDAHREVVFLGMQFGIVAEYYPEPTLLMHTHDLVKGLRSFDVTKMRNITVNP